MDQNNMPVTREEKMTVWVRRVSLLEYLQEKKRATVDELVNELNVSRRTVLRATTLDEANPPGLWLQSEQSPTPM